MTQPLKTSALSMRFRFPQQLFFGAIAALVALASFLGVILRDDPVGQLIFGGTWALVALFWLARLIRPTGSAD